MASTQLPTVDLSACYFGGIDEVAKQLKEAFRDFGCAYLMNHGIPQQQVTDCMKKSETFFQLPAEIKKKHARPKDARKYFGWFGMMKETASMTSSGDVKEAYNWTPWYNKVMPGDDVPGFTETLMTLHRSSYGLCNTLLKLTAKGLGFKDQNAMTKFCNPDTTPGCATIRSAYYPPITEDLGRKSDQLRCSEHTDQAAISLIFQDSCGGLEILTKSGEYVPVTPVEGAVVCLVGDVLQRWSSGLLLAPKHRVMDPPSGHLTEKRQSLIFFHLPDDDCVVGCLDGSDAYEPVTFKHFYERHNYSVKDPTL